jgi:hypothetical protein
MRNRVAVLAILVIAAFALAIPCGAQGVGIKGGDSKGGSSGCDITGTWYGGSNPQYQYLLSMTPTGAGRYFSSFQNGYDVHPIPPGYVAATAWVGETIKKGGKTFDSYIMSYWLWDPAAAAAAGLDPTLPEVDIVHSRIEFNDCDTFTSTIDVFGAYFSFTPDKTPFVTPLDASYLIDGPIVETYHRMPTTLHRMTAPPRPQPAVAAPGASVPPASKSPTIPAAAPAESKRRR